MDSDIYQSEPNLLAEVYRNQCNLQVPRQMEKHMDFLDINDDGYFLLGASNLSGRIWSGSIWIFDKFPSVPNVENSVARIEFESSVATGLWLHNKKVIVGSDSGSLYHLTLSSKEDNKGDLNFKIDAIVSEHDDSIVALDFLKNKSKIISGGMDMNIKIWDEEKFLNEKSYCPAHSHIVTSLSAQAHNSDTFVSTSLDGTCLIWDTRLEKPASLLLENECGFTGSSWINKNCIALGSNNGNISILDIRIKKELDVNCCSRRPIFNLKCNPELELLGVCADDPFVRIFSLNVNKLTCVYECAESHSDLVRGLAWNTKLKSMYSCGWDGKISKHIPNSES